MASKKTNDIVNDNLINEEIKEKKMTFEEAFAELDEIIKVLDDDKISLEDSFNNYKKGLELIKMCSDSIGEIEGKLEILESDGQDG